MSQLKKGALLSYVNIFLVNIIGLTLTPFIINSLGDAEYGLYMLIGSLVGSIGVLDFGLNNTIIRFVAKYRVEKDKKGEEIFLGTTMLIYFSISIFILLIGIVLYFSLESIFGKSLTIAEMTKAKIMFVILIFNLAITLPGGAFVAISNAYEHFVYPRIALIIKYLSRTMLVVLLLLLGGDAIGMVILDTVLNLLFILANFIYVFKKLRVTFNFSSFNNKMVKIIFSYSIWIFVFAVVQMFQWKSGQFVLGMNTDTVTVAIFAVGIMLGTYYGTFASAINGLVLPKATQMVFTDASSEELTNMMIKIGRVILMILGVILVVFIIIGKDFILLWIGSTYIDSYLIALLIMLITTIPLTQSFGNSLLEASNKIKVKAILNLITISLGTISGFYFSKVFDSKGMIYSITVAMFVNLVISNIYYVKIFNFQVIRFFYETYSKFILIFIVVLTVGYFINIKFQELSWLFFVVKASILICVYSILNFYIFLNKSEKTHILNYLKKRK